MAPCGQVRTAGGRGLGDTGRLPLGCQFCVTQTSLNHPTRTFGFLGGRPWGQVHFTVQTACPKRVTGLGAVAAESPGGCGQRLHVPSVCLSSDLSQNHLWTWTCGLFPHPVRQQLLVSRSVVSGSLRPPWTAARQAPLSMGFPRQEYWSGLLFPSPGGFFLIAWLIKNPPAMKETPVRFLG